MQSQSAIVLLIAIMQILYHWRWQEIALTNDLSDGSSGKIGPL